MKGKWIVFEGLDGSGTTTQLTRLHDWLVSQASFKFPIFLTVEPTEGPFGQICQNALHGNLTLDRMTLALAFTADRSHHLYSPEGILEQLSRGKWVLQDRYLYSTLAYQDGTNRDWIHALNSLFPRPDQVIYLQTPPQVCLERIHARGHQLELFDHLDQLIRVEQAYQEVFEIEKQKTNLVTIDGTQTADLIAEQIRRIVLAPDGLP